MLEFPHDVHTHTTYSDGRAEVSDVVAEAERRGLLLLGISDHSHYILGGSFEAYLREVKRWKEESALQVLSGVEANIGPGGSDVPSWAASKLDYVIASVHEWVETPEEYIELVKNALLDDNVDVIGHFGANFPHVGFPSEEATEEVLELAEAHGKAFEISSSYRVPELDFVRECVRRGIKLTFASDAHSPREVGAIRWSERVFKKAGGTKEDLLFGEFL